ncbi:hypothetical protein UFOVP192_34 [uncultured Caudovirales phage]|uniref:Uncharacterized protein n=1 Tax=uncultured Caudovirales phage TaxID=2100421 RepID=A0A6J7WFJ1_9CAUD|nr:hypothetical protein UFOVP192_34 [uncultured Caudovirales phage]
MITLHEAIYAINPLVVTIRGDVAYDKDEQVIEYDLEAAQAKLVELQAEETAKEQAAVAAKESALAKLAKLGLTEAEIQSLIG